MPMLKCSAGQGVNFLSEFSSISIHLLLKNAISTKILCAGLYIFVTLLLLYKKIN